MAGEMLERSLFNPLSRDDWPRPFRTFRDLDPGETFVEYEGSSIFLPIRATVDGKQVEERVKLRAFMRAELWPAYLGGLGTREFQFIIRDWELYGPSRLLSRLYFGDSRGRLRNADRAEEGRDQAVMTWTLARNYTKYGDDAHASLSPLGPGTLIDGVTDHNTDHGDLHWEIAKGSSGALVVEFYRAPPDGRERDDLVAVSDPVRPGERFVARSPVAAPAFAHKLPLRRETHGHGMSVTWALGQKPSPGARGRIHIATQPKSICIADRPPIPGMGEDSSDFPAHIIYTANFEVWANGACVAADQMGIAHAKGVRGIPPRDVKVAFEKPIQSDRFSFSSGMCLGMHEITPDEYHEGVNISRAVRARPL
jgi:hypothetical protein